MKNSAFIGFIAGDAMRHERHERSSLFQVYIDDTTIRQHGVEDVIRFVDIWRENHHLRHSRNDKHAGLRFTVSNDVG